MSTEITTKKPQGLKENWRPIPSLDFYYFASNFGRIASRSRVTSDGRSIKGRIMKLQKCGSGYAFFAARTPMFSGQMMVHRAVLSSFSGGMQPLDVNHKNGTKTDNALGNLEWANRSENQLHAAYLGLKPVGVESHLAKLTESNVRRIRDMLSQGMAQSKIAREFGVSQTAISKIKTNKKWKQLA